MTEDEARAQTIEIFGEESFTGYDDSGGRDRYYVGVLPKTPGEYMGFMGFSWEESLEFARKHLALAQTGQRSGFPSFPGIDRFMSKGT